MTNRKTLWFIFILTVIFTIAIGLDLSPYLRGPAPYFPDWRWTYQFTNTFSKAWFPALALIALLFFAFTIEKYSDKDFIKREKRYLWLLFLLSFVFQISIIYYSRAGLGVLVQRILNPGISGYFTASLSIINISDFMAHYSQNVGSFPMYAKFHPPGSIEIFYFLEQVIRLFPGIGFLIHYPVHHTDVKVLWSNLLPFQKTTVVVSAYLMSLLSGLTIFPLYYLSKLTYSVKAALRTSTLFVLIPSVTLFLPLNDTIFPFFSASALYFFVKGIKEKNNQDMVLAGIILFLGAFFTLTILSLLFAFLIIYILSVHKKELMTKKYLLSGIYFSVGFLVLPLLFFVIFYFNSFSVMQIILTYHEAVIRFRHNPLWLIYNFYDFFVFIGLPLAVIFFIMLREQLLDLFHKQKIDPLFISFCLMTISIDVLGTMNGEIGRTWLPFFPLILLPLVNFLTNRLKLSQSSYLIFLLFQGLQVIILQTFWVTVW